MATRNRGFERTQRGAPSGGTVLRVSLTDRCNLRCRYCMPAAGVRKLAHSEPLPFAELVGVIGWLARAVGVDRIKLSGGEPLVRRGVDELVRSVAATPGIAEVSATTNGSLLAPKARSLRAAGLARVNVSVDSLDAGRFAYLTRGGRLSDTLDGIDAALDAGLTPVKLNTVLLASSWREDVPALLDFAAVRGIELRLIELMRTGTEADWADLEFVPAPTVREWLEERARIETAAHPAAGAARRTRVTWRGAAVVVGWITPRSQPFCGTCNRLRLDARGRLRRCLMDGEAVPLADLLRALSEREVDGRLARYLAGKSAPSAMESVLPMVAVGG